MIKYNEITQLGFQRTESSDDSFFRIHGYQYFYMDKVLLKCKKGIEISAIWHPDDRKVKLMKCNREGDILSQKEFTEISEFKEYYEFLTLEV